MKLFDYLSYKHVENVKMLLYYLVI